MLPLAAPLATPYTTAHFVLGIDRMKSQSFAKCTGLAGSVSVEEYSEGGENRFVHRFPSRGSFPNLVLNQGIGPLTELWAWFQEFHVSGVVAPRGGSVMLMSSVDGQLKPVRVWKFVRGWPVSITGPDLDAQSSAVAIDAVEIAHHGLTLDLSAV